MLLQKKNSQLYEHLQSRGALDKLPYDAWFNDIFAGVLPTGVLERWVFGKQELFSKRQLGEFIYVSLWVNEGEEQHSFQLNCELLK